MDVEIYQGEEPPIFRSKVTKKNSNDDKEAVFLVSPNKLPNKQTMGETKKNKTTATVSKSKSDAGAM